MTRILYFLAVFTAACSSLAQSTTTNAPSAAKPGTNAPAGIMLFASNAVVVAPLYLTNGFLTQSGTERTDGLDGGMATFEFSITNAGDYVIYAVANATSEDSNSFFLNIDGDTEDPLMIWDIAVTTAFEEGIVNWRGSGASGADEFDPKVFKLMVGKHKLVIYGREPDAQVKSFSIRPSPPPATK